MDTNMLKKFFENHPAVVAWLDSFGFDNNVAIEQDVFFKKGLYEGIPFVPDTFTILRFCATLDEDKKYGVWCSEDDSFLPGGIKENACVLEVFNFYTESSNGNKSEKNSGMIKICANNVGKFLHIVVNDSPYCPGIYFYIYPLC